MKKLLTGMLSLALLAATAVPALATDSQPLIAPAPAAAEETASTGYTIEIDGRDSAARARIMVPLRALAEELGFTVAWDNGLVTVTGPDRYAELTIGVDQYFAAPTLDDPRHEKAWLLRVAANLSKNRIDYNRIRLTDELNEELIAEEREDLSFVWEAVKALPAHQREAVHLFYYEGYTAAEIGAMLGRRESTVRSDLRRGRAKLKEILKEAYDFEEGI